LATAAAVCVVVGAALPVAFAIASGAAVAAVPAAVRDGTGSGGSHRLFVAVVVVGFLLAAQQTLAPVQDAVGAMLARRVQRQTYRRSMVAALTPRTIAHLEDPELLDLVGAATILTPGGPSTAVRSFLIQWRRLLSALAALALVGYFHWWLAVVVLGTELWLLRSNRAMYNQLIVFRVLQMPSLRRAVYLRNLAMNPDAAKETRVFGLGGWVVERFRRAWLGAMTEVWRQRKGNGLRLATALAPVVAAQLVAAVLLGRAVIHRDIGLGAMVAYAQALLASMQLCVAGDDIAVEEGAAVVRATEELERIVATDERLHLSGDGAPPDDAPHDEIRLEGVCFRYAGRDRDVLRDFDLVIPAGRSLAVVGENGAGKTTLVKLIARMYDPTAGRILVDGHDLRDLDAAAWQRRVAAVFQDFVRYPLTAAENVGFGACRGPAHDAAAARANALELIEGLPRKWETILTRDFEGGVDLSGGEWQRLALARALFAAAATPSGLLILDEPTAHLDARAEASFIEGFLDVTRGCTTIVISHRFSTVRRADHIVVVDGGRVTESGTHDELMAAGGHYARMFGVQAERFAGA
jgi:ATP-binding cassette subfamily B protein